VFTTDDSLEVVAELAGMDGNDIDVLVEGDVLSIRGFRERPQTGRITSFYEARIPFGPFVAELAIPFEIEWDNTSAQYNNGVLTISLPRRQPRTVVVKNAVNTNREVSDT
jgi:HSP20 family protein